MIHTAEAVSCYHPDKICDLIADYILTEYLRQDKNSRVAIEVLGGHGEIVVKGEVTSKVKVNIKKLVKKFYKKNLGKNIKVKSKIVRQSPEISKGVDKGGAGDQGIMIGYACRENSVYLPQELYLAKCLVDPFKCDAKSQVTIRDGKISVIVLSVSGKQQKELDKYVREFLMIRNEPVEKDFKIYCNPTGSFDVGGFDADCGTVGRKIVNDQYGPRVPVGGGAFSGKDPSKVDRSGAYMARWIALQYLKKYPKAKEVLVKLAYVIGMEEPVMKVAVVDGKEKTVRYDCRPKAIIKRFKLKDIDYFRVTCQGNFGTGAPWEND